MTKNQKLFNQCLQSWRSFQDIFATNLGNNIEAYDFTADHDLFFINLRLLDEINTESTKILEGHYLDSTIYFNALTEHREQVQKCINKYKINYQLDGSMGFNIWTKQVESKDFSNYQLLAGRIDSDIYEEYKDITIKLFGANDDSIPRNNRKFLTSMPIDHEIIILKEKEKSIGTACYCVSDGVAWMFGGSIFPEYRNQGIWKYMVKIRQEHSLKFGANFWFIQTVNKFIEEKSDEFFKLDCWKHVSK
jgi:hypothetical protein